ncbi:hypothetical protein C8R48DRAFT_668958 [Suillus tomentosus]|nr:hypothetical protein C8R48DRAFT_668958 [Suillus tomentosus]
MAGPETQLPSRFSTSSSIMPLLPLPIHATCATHEYPGKLLSQNHWVASHVQFHSDRKIQLKDILSLEDYTQIMYHYIGVFDKVLRVSEGWVEIRVQKDQSHGSIPPVTLTIPIFYIRLPFYWRLKYACLQRLKTKRFRHHPMVTSSKQPVGQDRHSQHYQPEPIRVHSRIGALDVHTALDLLAADYPEGSCEDVLEDFSEDGHNFKDTDFRSHHYHYTDGFPYY